METTTETSFSAGRPRVLFEGEDPGDRVTAQLGTDYDVSPDGQRFLMVKESARTSSTEQINVVLNWLQELKRRVPAN